MKLFIILTALLAGCASRPRSELSVEVRAEQAERPSVVVAYRLEMP